MASKVQIHLVEAALLTLLPDRLFVSYGQKVHVATIGREDFGDDGQLTLTPPAVRIHFGSASYGQARDTQKTTLSASLIFSIFCYDESLKSKADERTRTLQLVAAVQDELAGARLQLTPGVFTEPVLMKDVVQAMDAAGPVDQVYAVVFEVSGFAQFSGVNANFGARA